MKIIAITASILGFRSGAVVGCTNTSPNVKNIVEIKDSDRELTLKSIEVSLGGLGNLFFLAMAKGSETEAEKTVGDDAKVTVVSGAFNLNQQFNQIENFITANTDVIVVSAVDHKGIKPAIGQARRVG